MAVVSFGCGDKRQCYSTVCSALAPSFLRDNGSYAYIFVGQMKVVEAGVGVVLDTFLVGHSIESGWRGGQGHWQLERDGGI